MLCSAVTTVLAMLFQGALFSLPASESLSNNSTAVPVYKNAVEIVYIGTPGENCRVLDTAGNAPGDYFMVYPRAFHPGESLESYGEVVYRDSDIAITLPGPGTSPTPTAAARRLREIRAPGGLWADPRKGGLRRQCGGHRGLHKPGQHNLHKWEGWSSSRTGSGATTPSPPPGTGRLTGWSGRAVPWRYRTSP